MCDDKEIEEITQLINELTLMKKEIKHNTIVDSNKILKRYEIYSSEIDSGFDSEPQQLQQKQSNSEQLDENFILPAYNLQEIVFESSDFDEVLKNLFKYVWQCLQQSIANIEKNQSRIETILECIKDFIVFLSDKKNDFFREQMVKKNLELLFAKGMEQQTDDLFNFVMEIYVKLGSMNELFSCIINLIIEKIKIFADKVTIEKPNGEFLFKYETDFSRVNTLLITAQILKKEKQHEFKIDNEKDICDILHVFVNQKDFYILEFLSQQLFLE